MQRILTLLVAAVIMTGCGGVEGLIEFLHEPPDVDRLPGSYVLDPRRYSHSSLKTAGYDDLSATLRLRADGTFSFARIPDCCLFGESGFFGGYFAGSGKWKVEKSSAVFVLRLSFGRLERNGSALPTKQTPGAAELNLTKGSPDYGLAAPLFDGGDFVYVYFRRMPENPP